MTKISIQKIPVIALILVGVVTSDTSLAADELPPPNDRVEPGTDATTLFENAWEYYSARAYQDAALHFWRFLDAKGHKQRGGDYDRAIYYLAESLYQLNFIYAATYYFFDIAKNRTHPDLIPRALARLEQISRKHPINEGLVYRDLLVSEDMGDLPEPTKSWTHYVQGRINFQDGYSRWAKFHFSTIHIESDYYSWSQYIYAVYKLSKNLDKEALEMLTSIAEATGKPQEPKNLALFALARLAYDNKDYQGAMAHYDKISVIEQSHEQAELLLEKAWTAYQLHQVPKALGFLHSLGAPSYNDYFLPDRYILEATILKEWCHFTSAKSVLETFYERFGEAFSQLERREPLYKIYPILSAAAQNAVVSKTMRYLHLLYTENNTLKTSTVGWREDGLGKQLTTLYTLEIQNMGHQFHIKFSDIAPLVAKLLLDAEEQIRLLRYDIEVDANKRFQSYAFIQHSISTASQPSGNKPPQIIYPFVKEYWNDELHTYDYQIKNICNGESESP